MEQSPVCALTHEFTDCKHQFADCTPSLQIARGRLHACAHYASVCKLRQLLLQTDRRAQLSIVVLAFLVPLACGIGQGTDAATFLLTFASRGAQESPKFRYIEIFAWFSRPHMGVFWPGAVDVATRRSSTALLRERVSSVCARTVHRSGGLEAVA